MEEAPAAQRQAPLRHGERGARERACYPASLGRSRGMRTPLLLCCALVLLLTAPPHHVAAAAAQPLASASRIRVQWVSDLELHLDPRHPCTAALSSGAIVAEGSRERRRHALRRAAALPRRALLVSDAQAQAQLDDLDKQAGALAASLLDAVHVGLAAAEGRPGGSATAPATESAPSPAAPTLSGFFANSLDAINRRAPVIHMPDGYSIKPRVHHMFTQHSPVLILVDLARLDKFLQWGSAACQAWVAGGSVCTRTALPGRHGSYRTCL